MILIDLKQQQMYIYIYIYIAYKHCDFTHTKSQKLGSNLDPVNFQKYVLVNLSDSVSIFHHLSPNFVEDSQDCNPQKHHPKGTSHSAKLMRISRGVKLN